MSSPRIRPTNARTRASCHGAPSWNWSGSCRSSSSREADDRAMPTPMNPTLDTCLRRDQLRLRRERDRLRDQRLRGNDVAAAEAALAGKIAASSAARAARAASVPAISYPEELPISANRDSIREAIEKHPVVIICGETGSG